MKAATGALRKTMISVSKILERVNEMISNDNIDKDQRQEIVNSVCFLIRAAGWALIGIAAFLLLKVIN